MKKGKNLEPPEFWSGIADNEKIDVWRRGLAIYFLFDRHLEKNATLSDLARMVKKPSWINEAEISIVTKRGVIHLETSPGDTMFQIVVFSNKDIEKHNKESIGIYLNVSGQVGKSDFYAALMGREDAKCKNRKLKGWAFFPKWNDYILRGP